MTNKNDLRERAEHALHTGKLNVDDIARSDILSDMQKLIEELRIYQAELELQNEELRRAQLETKYALTQYATLFKSLPLPAIVLDHRGIIEDANTQATELFGFHNNKKIMQHAFYRFVSDNDRTRLFKLLNLDNTVKANVIHDMTVFSAKGDVLNMDGHLIHLSVDYHLNNYTLLLLVDRSAELAREHDRHLFQALLDNTPAIIEVFDKDGYCQLANTAMLNAINRTADQVIGIKREMWQSTQQAASNESKDQTVFDTQTSLLEEEIFTHETGQQHYISNRFPLKNQDGDVFAVAAVKTDITDIRKMESRLQLAMRVFSKGSEGIIITDKNNQIIFVNKAFEKITGYSEAEIIGKNPSFLSSGIHTREFYQNLWATLLTEGEWQGELYDRRKNGECYPQYAVLSRVLDDNHQVSHFIGIFNDLTNKKKADEKIYQLAFYDPLTGTPNRNLFQSHVAQAIEAAKHEHTQFSLMFLDLDHFKEINDTLGHSIGDNLLIQVAKRLENEIRDKDTLCRFGGDEFVILFSNMNAQNVVIKAERILSTLLNPYMIDGHKLVLSASIGIAVYPRDGKTYATLLKNADMAMYQAKENGRNNFHFFKTEMANSILKHMAIEHALHDAIENNEFWLAYQPQISVAEKKVTGVEVLLRWQNAALNNPSPDDFITVAESTGLIVKIGTWVLKQALKQTKTWLDSGLQPFTVAVNISARQFWDDNFINIVQQTLEETQVPAHYLELELTEQLVMKKPDAVIKVMNQLKSLGVQISIDDFGTGYSSLSYLKRLPADKLKIDKSFVRDIGIDSDDQIIVLSIVQLAKALNKKTIAEGVETIQQERFLSSINCDIIQGYLYAKPMPVIEFETWLNTIFYKC